MFLINISGNKLWNLKWDPLKPDVKEEELRTIVQVMFHPLKVVLDSKATNEKLRTPEDVRFAEETLADFRTNQIYVSNGRDSNTKRNEYFPMTNVVDKISLFSHLIPWPSCIYRRERGCSSHSGCTGTYKTFKKPSSSTQSMDKERN
jgi:hypothetical protein